MSFSLIGSVIIVELMWTLWNADSSLTRHLIEVSSHNSLHTTPHHFFWKSLCLPLPIPQLIGTCQLEMPCGQPHYISGYHTIIPVHGSYGPGWETTCNHYTSLILQLPPSWIRAQDTLIISPVPGDIRSWLIVKLIDKQAFGVDSS